MINQKKKGIIISIGLVVLTILVVGGIFLTMYLTEKNSREDVISYTKIQINEEGKTDIYSFMVTGVSFEEIDNNYSYAKISFKIKAKDNVYVENGNFGISGAEFVSSENIPTYISSGNEQNFVIIFKVKKYSELYLTYDVYKVALGSAF